MLLGECPYHLVVASSVPKSEWAEAWQVSWDRLEESLIPNREWLLSGVVDVVEATVGSEPLVVDLACGTGTVALRLLHRLSGARVVAVDIDPVLLEIASATFVADDRVRIVAADLRDPAWCDALPTRQVDAVVKATALHWLPEAVLRRLYHDLAGLIRVGGVFAHAEEMPLAESLVVSRDLDDLLRRRSATGSSVPGWDEWWAKAATDPDLAEAFKARSEVFQSTYAAEEFSPPAVWHESALIGAGFREASVVYRAAGAAVLAAVR